MKSPSPLLLRASARYLLHHHWQAALALTGIVLGVAVVLAVDIANTAAHQSFQHSTAQLRGAATHRLVDPSGPLDQTLYTELFTQPGHPPMAPVISARVRVPGHEGRYRLLGVDLLAEGGFRDTLAVTIDSQTSLTEWLTDPNALALSQSAAQTFGVARGDRLTLRFEGRPAALTVVAVYPDPSAMGSDLLLVDIATAQAITVQPQHLSHIDLALDADSRNWIAQRLPASVHLLEAKEQAAGIAGMSAAFELNLTAMSLLALLVGMFLIFNAINFAVVQRRTLLGRLRALGVTPREIRRLILAEALILAIVGTVLGIGLGVLLGRGLTGIVATAISALYYEVSAEALALEPWTLLKAGLLGIGGTLGASWLPSRQAASTPPLTTLSRSTLESGTQRSLRWAGWAGIALIALGLVVARVLPGGVVMGFIGLFILLLGTALLTPLTLRLAHRMLHALNPPLVWRMAVRDLDRHLSRLATAAAALMIALAASVGVAIMVESMRGSVDAWLDSLLSADLYVSADSFEEGETLPEGVIARAEALAEVGATSLYRSRTIMLGGAPLSLIGAQLAEPSRDGFRFRDRSPEVVWADFDRGAILISEPLANRRDLRAGEQLSLPTPAGMRDVAIAGVFQDYASERGRIFIPLSVFRATWNDPAVNNMALFARDGNSEALRAAAITRLGNDHDLAFAPARAIYDESMATFDRTFLITEVLRYLSLLVAFVGVFSALMAIQLERRHEYAVLRALGFTGGQLAKLIMAQSLILGALAGLVAVPTGLLMAWVLTDVIQLRAFGWTMQYLVTPSPLILTLILGMLAAALASLYPAWQGARHNPAPQLRED